MRSPPTRCLVAACIIRTRLGAIVAENKSRRNASHRMAMTAIAPIPITRMPTV
ncbi:MAG: hypothetical protein R3C05_27925 [Pirellulaceae bacterium]